MAYTILIQNDNTAIATEKQRIMQYSKLVDVLRFIVPKTYNGWDVVASSFVLQYKTPITHTLKLATLKIVDENYKDNYYLYTLDIDTDITAEVGNVEFQASFKEISMDVDGNVISRNREISEFEINVIPVSKWFVAPDEALDTLTQYYLANQQQINALTDLAGILSQKKADNINLNVFDGQIYLTSNGKQIGDPISLEELANILVDYAGNSEGNISIVKD